MQTKYPPQLLLRSALAAAFGVACAWAGDTAYDETGALVYSSPRGAALTEMRSRARFPFPHIAIFYPIGTPPVDAA